jgi:hypothetical protein
MEPTAWSKPCRRAVRAGARAAIAVALWIAADSSPAAAAPPVKPAADPFARFDLPDSWEARFWASTEAIALFRLDLEDVADLVPVQAGIRFCRCPSCDAPEADDPLTWSVVQPKVLTCKRCGAIVPKEHPPAQDHKDKCKVGGDDKKEEDKDKEKDKKSGSEDTIEVLHGVTHHYPYEEVEPTHQRYPGERLYLAAKRDYEAREFLAKAALYAAVRYREQPPGNKDPALARVAAVILVRCAQVYPAYAVHLDQPESPKFFQKANLAPPYQSGYRTAKWDWTGSQDVPLNLVVAYALLRGHPAFVEAGRLLNEPDPARAVEHNLFRASAEFVRRQPEELSEAALKADRGLLAVGRLLNDPDLVHDALARLDRFAERGFYYDGFWRQGTFEAHRRVLGQLDGWIDRLLAGYADPPGFTAVRGGRRLDAVPGVAQVPMLALAHMAASAVLTDPGATEVQQAAWPAPLTRTAPRAPMLLGGTGLARLAIGQGDNALDIELRGLDAFGLAQIRRQALRVAVAGRTVLGDLDDVPATGSGFERASVSRNTVVVDGLNQRESLARAREPVAGGNFVFFAADPDFQVVTLDDRRAYPQSVTRYRQTIVASSSARSRYALAIFEVDGGLQHDQLFHGPAGSPARWQLSVPTNPGPSTLLAPGLTYVPNARAEDGRWFVQAYGEFTPLTRATVARPAQATLAGTAPGGVRLHLLGDAPLTAVTATSPDPTLATHRAAGDDTGRGSLILRRRSTNGSSLRTTFVTLIEPIATAVPPLSRIGRVRASNGAVVVYLETAEGPEYLVVNLSPGKAVAVTLADGRTLSTDGLAVRFSSAGLVLAGGTFAECAGAAVRQGSAGGKIIGAVRQNSGESGGWFESDSPLPDPDALTGRVMLVRHGDGSTRGWTLQRVENHPAGARLHVREEPGFEIDTATGYARYYQFPQARFAGPHSFRVSRITR